MAYQLQISFRTPEDIPANELDLLAYKLSLQVQQQFPCKIFGYGVVNTPAPEQARFVSPEPAVADQIRETATPIRMGIAAAGLSDDLL